MRGSWRPWWPALCSDREFPEQDPPAVALPLCHRLSFWRASEPTEPTWLIDHWGEMQDSYRTSPFAKALPPRDAWLQCAWESIYLWMRGEGAAPTAPPMSKLSALDGPVITWRELRNTEPMILGKVAAYKPTTGGRPAIIA